MKNFKLSKLAELLPGEFFGPDLLITGVATFNQGKSGEITFVDNEKKLKTAEQTPVSALILPKKLTGSQKAFIRVENPRLAFARLLQLFYLREKPQPFIHPTAVIETEVKLGEEIYLGPQVVVKKNSSIGKGSVLKGLNYIGERVTIGENALIYPGAIILDDSLLGNNVILHAGVVIGSDGFGYEKEGSKLIKIPQVGRVVIEDEVEIGANTTIDRATLGETRIKKGTKIDNLVQIAHNLTVGEDCIIVAQVGIAGSTVIEDRVTIAGQAGIAQHITVGADSMIGGQSGVTKSIPPKSFVSGYPARPHRQSLKIQALLDKMAKNLNKLPDFKEKSQ